MRSERAYSNILRLIKIELELVQRFTLTERARSKNRGEKNAIDAKRQHAKVARKINNRFTFSNCPIRTLIVGFIGINTLRMVRTNIE